MLSSPSVRDHRPRRFQLEAPQQQPHLQRRVSSGPLVMQSRPPPRSNCSPPGSTKQRRPPRSQPRHGHCDLFPTRTKVTQDPPTPRRKLEFRPMLRLPWRSRGDARICRVEGGYARPTSLPLRAGPTISAEGNGAHGALPRGVQRSRTGLDVWPAAISSGATRCHIVCVRG